MSFDGVEYNSNNLNDTYIIDDVGYNDRNQMLTAMSYITSWVEHQCKAMMSSFFLQTDINTTQRAYTNAQKEED